MTKVNWRLYSVVDTVASAVVVVMIVMKIAARSELLIREVSEMKIYVASSWRNKYQPGVVKLLRENGHEVYDFRDDQGFSWSEVDLEWKAWTPQDYLEGLKHPSAERGFNRDMTALRECDACVYVMPCGPSASMEMGWAVAAGKYVIVYVPELRDPDLMVKMTPHITTDIEQVRRQLQDFDRGQESARSELTG